MEKGEIKTFGTLGTDLWNGGITLRLVVGWHIRPVKPVRYWLSKSYNCWQGDEPWFVLSFPIIFPFLSACIGRGGFYIGCKVYEYDLDNSQRYWWFPKCPYGEYLTFSFSVRRTR